MPKLIDYPRASLKRSIELAQAVYDLGGECNFESAADKIGNKISGAFNALMAATVKYGFVSSKGGRLITTQLFKDYRLSYDEVERTGVLRKALLNVPLFRGITERFSGMVLPEKHFEKLLIREFHVPEGLSSRVAGYYLEGVKLAALINDTGQINSNNENNESSTSDNVGTSTSSVSVNSASLLSSPVSNAQAYRVRISGPDIDSTIEITDENDLAIVNAMLTKLRRRLGI